MDIDADIILTICGIIITGGILISLGAFLSYIIYKNIKRG